LSHLNKLSQNEILDENKEKEEIYMNIDCQNTENFNSEYYYIDNINILSNNINLIKIYDKNGIKVNIDHYIKNGFYTNMLLDEFYFQKSNINIMSKEESDNLLKEHSDVLKNDKQILKIFYSLNDNIEYDNDNEYSYQQNINTNFFIRKTSLKQPRKYNIEKILPENLSNLIDEYSIENNAEGLINDIRNKSENLKVLFITEEIKFEDKSSKTYQSLPIGIHLYFSMHKTFLNILHIDFIDTNLKNVKNVEIIDYNFKRTSQGNKNIPSNINIVSHNVDAFKVRKFEEEIVKQFFDLEENKLEDKLLVLIRNLKSRRIVLRKINGEIMEFKSQDFNIKLDKFCKILPFEQNYQNNINGNNILNCTLTYANCIAKINYIPINQLINHKVYDLKNLQIFSKDDKLIQDNEYKSNGSQMNVNIDKDVLMQAQSEFEIKFNSNKKIVSCEINKNENNFQFFLNNCEFSNKRCIEIQLVFDSNENYIDILNSQNISNFSENELYIFVSPCLMVNLENPKELECGKLIMEKEKIFNTEEISLLKKIRKNIDEYSVYFTDNSINDSFFNLTEEEKSRINSKIIEDLQNMNKISFYIESKELWEYIEVIFKIQFL